MGTTTFTGPIKAGNVLATTGTTVGKLANVGSVVMAQSVSVQASTTAVKTGIVVPANSQIIAITIIPSVGFGSSTTLGTTSAATNLTDSKNLPINTLAWFDPLSAGAWEDVGSTDVEIWLKSGAAVGTGVLILRYIQNNNVTA